MSHKGEWSAALAEVDLVPVDLDHGIGRPVPQDRASETKGYGTPDAGTWTYTYDPVTLGIATRTDPDGNVSTFSYDDNGNRTSASDGRGYTTGLGASARTGSPRPRHTTPSATAPRSMIRPATRPPTATTPRPAG